MSETFLSRWSRRKRAASSPPPQGEGGEDRGSEPGGGHLPPLDTPVEKIEGPPTPNPSPPRASRAGGGEPRGRALCTLYSRSFYAALLAMAARASVTAASKARSSIAFNPRQPATTFSAQSM